MKLTNIAYIILLLAFAFLKAKAQNPDYVLDFEKNGNNLSTLEKAGVELYEVTGLRYQRDLPQGLYLVKVPNNNRYMVDAARGAVNLELDNVNQISSLELKTGRLNIRQAEELGRIFHESHNLDETQMNVWLEGIENQTEMDFYTNGVTYNYPAIAFQFYKTFYPPEPISLKLYFEWDEKLTKRRGVGLKSNQELNINYNAPEILASLPQEHAVAGSSDSTPETEEVTEESSAIEPETQKPAEVKTPETTKEPTEQTSNWWLWLIGAVVVVGSIGLIVRRKS